MAQIEIRITCPPEELKNVLDNLRASFGGYPETELRTVPVLGVDMDALVHEVTGVGGPSLNETPTDSPGAEAEAKKRTRRTRQQIAEDNERQAKIDAARKAEIEAGTPSVHELKDAEANPPETTATQDITSSLFSVGTPAEVTPPKSDPVATVAQTADGAPEVTFESLQTFVVKLGKEYKVPFPRITEALGKHLAAAGVSTARELSGTQRGAALQDLLTLHPGATL